MRYGLIALALLAAAAPAWAQQDATRAVQTVQAPPPSEICMLPFRPGAAYHYVPAPPSSKAAAATITVTYIDGIEPWPQEAIVAYEYAVSLWEEALVSSQPIQVDAFWGNLGGCSGSAFTLGSAGPRNVHRGGRLPADVWFPTPLANHLTGRDLNDDAPEITSTFNAACDDVGNDRWYFGLDATPPATQVDFVSVVLHELGHGLGFTGAGNVEENDVNTDADDVGSVRTSSFPIVYDTFTEDGSGTSLVEGYPPTSNPLALALEGQRGGVYFDGPETREVVGDRIPLYVPDDWEPGSSYSHLDEETFNDTPSALMTPQLEPAEAIHLIGPATCGLLQDLGWTFSISDCTATVGVELVAFEAEAEDGAVVLTWQTTSEQDNAGFEVQLLPDEGAPEVLGFVEGAGTTDTTQFYRFETEPLEPGRYTFRLRQLDDDGSDDFSREVEVTVLPAEGLFVSEPRPQPFVRQTTLLIEVADMQDLRATLYDAVGRRIATYLLDDVPPGALVPLRIDGTELAPGVYIVRVVSSEGTSETRQVVHVR